MTGTTDSNFNNPKKNEDKEEEKPLTEFDVEVDEVPPREIWNNKIDFILATLGYIVGYGNFWRFPYLCYRNGGASFLFPYFLMLFLIGIPMFFMELAIGQWYNRGFISLWKAVCPLSRGLGYATIIMQFISSVYYIVILAWVLFFFFDSFRSEVPWSGCDNDWNTPFCRVQRTSHQVVNCTAFNLPVNCTQEFTSPSSEYWNRRVLQITDSIEVAGSMRWELVGTLILSWVLVYFCIFKSIKLTGKVTYFTATFPLIMIVVMLIRGVSLEGAAEGVLFYLKPDFKRLTDPQVWVYATTQIFWSLGIGFGGVVTFGSFNTFKNNVHSDSLIVSLSNCGTSFLAGFAVFGVLGFMAYVLRTTVKNVVASGPGLVFIVYPEAISQMPLSVLWAVLFFFMLITLGIDTMFGAIEAFVTAIIDENPGLLRKRKWMVVGIASITMFICGLPCVLQGGMYIFNLFDYQSAGISLLFCVWIENIFIAWIYGIDRFSSDVEIMTGRKPYRFIQISLKYISPVVSAAIILANLIQWNGIKYDGVPYPGWAEFIGWVMCLIPVCVFFSVAFYQLWKTPGSFMERWRIVTTPDQKVLAEIEEQHGVTLKRKPIYL